MINTFAFFHSINLLNLVGGEGSCVGLRARHEVTSFPPGKSRGLTRCMTPHIYKDDDAWHTEITGGQKMKSFYLGIDVSKGYADFVILNQMKQSMAKNFQLDDTFEGHNRLYEIIRKFLKKHPQSILYAGVESTGGYEKNWYHTLINFQSLLNIQTALLNPLGVVHNARADLKRNKTDKISAQSVAEYLIAHAEKIVYNQQDRLAGLKKQWNFVQTLTKQKTQFINQLHSYLYTANPEILGYCRDGMPAWVLKLLSRYPTATKLRNARAVTVAKLPYVSFERARQLIAQAKHSVASDNDPITAQLISTMVIQILSLKKTINEQVKLMNAELQIPEIQLIKTFVGIGDLSAIGLMIEIESIARFKTAKQLTAYWGLHPVYKESGDGAGGFKMSKQGRVNPRKILYTVALTAIEHNPVIKELYQYQLFQGKKKMAAMGICMHKIARIIYGMLKSNTSFDPDIDKINRKRSLPDLSSRSRSDKSRRFQKYDAKAPISRRQHKKRQERELSQSVSQNTQAGIKPLVPLQNIITKITNSKQEFISNCQKAT